MIRALILAFLFSGCALIPKDDVSFCIEDAFHQSKTLTAVAFKSNYNYCMSGGVDND